MPPEFPFDSGNLHPLPPLAPALVRQTSLHKSVVGNERARSLEYEALSYKPLEFHGDAVIEFHVTRILRERLPQEGPGVLTVSCAVLSPLEGLAQR